MQPAIHKKASFFGGCPVAFLLGGVNMSKGRKRLGDLLIEAGLLSGEQLEKALKVQ